MAAEVTVVMSVYNGMPHLPAAVASILDQTLKEFRFLIIDDGSTDASAEYLDHLRDDRIELVHQDNRGLGASLNRGIELCRTPYLARMDADDVSVPERLERQLAHMKANADLVMLSSQVAFLCGRTRFAGPPKPLTHEVIRGALLRRGSAVCHGACLFRTEALREIGGYRIAGAGQDTDVFLRMCEQGQVENLREVLYLIGVHRESVCYTDRDRVNRVRAYAIECANRRAAGDEEPTLTQYEADWRRRGLVRKMLDRIDSWSSVQYRRALLDFSQSKSLRGTARLGAACVCRPRGVLKRIRARLNGRD